MSANGNDLSTEFVIGAAAAVSLVLGIFSAAAAFINEDDANGMRDKATAVACEVIADNLLKGRTKRERIVELTLDQVVAVKKRYVYWDRKRARECIAQDYLGVQPTFGPDDFKKIFRISRASYDEIHNYLCGVQSFFKDGHQVTNRQKIIADGKILMAYSWHTAAA
jgi:hypothetical protein